MSWCAVHGVHSIVRESTRSLGGPEKLRVDEHVLSLENQSLHIGGSKGDSRSTDHVVEIHEIDTGTQIGRTIVLLAFSEVHR